MPHANLVIALCAAALFAAQPAGAAPVRSDLPLWPTDGDDVWPKPFAESGEIGVVSNIGVGDWRLRAVGCESEGDDDNCFTWLRLGFASMFDGGFVVTEARTREGLDSAIGEHAYLVVLPGVAADGSKLLALQIGFMGGSRYMLLRGRGQAIHDALDVLDGSCAGAGALTWFARGYRERQSRKHGYFRTNYCAVRSAKGLAQLATRMAAAKQIMEFIGPADQAGQPADTPSQE